MTLKELLDTRKDFDCELFGDFEATATFVWENMELTEEGYKEFQPIMDCQIEYLSNGNIQVLVGEDSDERLSTMVDDFVLASAGYCSCANYDKWFRELNCLMSR